ncbi:MAG: hypothetical protein M3R51_03190 [Candidatus Eremiobacteraeota bacterium]|nr:hypothetical protein [Candidatus Eremiobacteraeota bacterium]
MNVTLYVVAGESAGTGTATSGKYPEDPLGTDVGDGNGDGGDVYAPTGTLTFDALASVTLVGPKKSYVCPIKTILPITSGTLVAPAMGYESVSPGTGTGGGGPQVADVTGVPEPPPQAARLEQSAASSARRRFIEGL